MKMFQKIIVAIFYLSATGTFCLAYDNALGPDYGNQWFLFVDENGTTHEVHISTLPVETRGLFLGKVKCYLFTRKNCDKGELLTPPTLTDKSEVDSIYFNPSNDIKALTHGWLSSGNTEWLQNMKNKILSYSDTNVIIVDWGEIAKNPLYPWPAFSTRYVGKYLARVLNSLMRGYDVSGTTHLVGHSLGAHVMGYAGMFADKPLQRITGLDPARPLFEIPPMTQSWRLDKTDAEFVDIIHTCGGVYGYKRSHGHADFYPNNGEASQPGCEGIQQHLEACSHGRAHEYFMESIDSHVGFYSYPCENWDQYKHGICRLHSTLMGYPANSSSKGDFYLNTNNHSEYACGE